jgi:O-antigen/teichoic acid export membrane protein
VRLFRFSWKLGVSNAAAYVLLNAAIFVLGFGDPTQAGLYAAASRLTFPGSLFLESFAASFAPHAVNKIGDPSLEHDVQRVTLWMVSASTPVFILLIAFAGTWMGLLGPEFESGAPVLVIMAVAQLINILTGPSGMLVGVSHRPELKILNTVLAWGTNLALVVLLTPQYGALGAAVAFLVAVIIIDILEYSEVYFVLHVRGWGKWLLRPFAVIAALGIGLITFAMLVPLSLSGVIFVSAAFLALYAISMWNVGLPVADTEAIRLLTRSLPFRRPVRT